MAKAMNGLSITESIIDRSSNRLPSRFGVAAYGAPTYGVASYSYAFALLPDAYQGEVKSEKTYLPCVPNVFDPDGAELGKRDCV
jgi:hypothetical protein